ncbi:YqjD family protein [Notoacmeibacter sp. MSK16QG-6]|uniref:DUF883 family protein n=1 Tax=Notoacmeibacter sp. MSK16QG-6 TaxID=2957982 RepID=UPI0020A13F96|nr:hypothetical protein [Notoacmeibacter sp. MSK16QG-6]MCP1199745.1 hypothetical protein [Notoacmeibacter sp. MSK16QG-6]
MANTTGGSPAASAPKKPAGTTTTSNDVENEIAQLRADVASLTDTIKSFGAATARDLQDRAYGKRDEISDQLRAKEEEIKERVRENPMQALGIAAGVGFLVGVIWRS